MGTCTPSRPSNTSRTRRHVAQTHFAPAAPSRVRNRVVVDTDRRMPCTRHQHPTRRLRRDPRNYGVVDAKGLADMIGRSHRTVMVLAAEAAWHTWHLPRRC